MSISTAHRNMCVLQAAEFHTVQEKANSSFESSMPFERSMLTTRKRDNVSVRNTQTSTMNLKRFMPNWMRFRRSFTRLLSMALLWTPTSPSLGTAHT